MSASFAISALLSRLRESSIQETIAFLGVNEQVEVLLLNLRNLQSFMVDADERLDKDKRIRGWVAEIRDICYEAEDVLDDYALKVASMRRRVGFKDAIKRYFCNSCEIVAGNKVEIATFSGRINNLMDLLRQHDDRVVSAAEGESSNEPRRLLSLSRVPSLFTERNIVRLEAESKQLLSHLLSGNTKDLVIAICGMGGAGKTTLAQVIYGSVETVEYFDVRDWVTISQAYEMRSVLLKILSQITVHGERIQQFDDMALLEMLYKILKGRRYLVVLDDVWSLDVWQELHRALPQDGNNSKVLVTTRNRNLARQIVGHGYVHEIRPLTIEESLALFKTRAFPNGGPDDPALEKIAKDILRNCQGQPLAIEVLGSFLAGKTLSEWEMARDRLVSMNLGTDFGSEASIDVTKAINLSYKHLPSLLKPCFLYLGHFPEDSELEAEKLYLLWMAEGIIPLGQGEETVMEMGSSRLDDLVARSLVIAQDDEVPTIRKFKSCRLHELQRSFCLRKAKEDNIFYVLELRRSNILKNDYYLFPSTGRKIRRLAMYLGKYDDGDSIDLRQTVSGVMEKANHLRSLMFFNAYHHDQYILWPEEISSTLKELRFLRVLEFDGFDFQSGTLPKGIEKLIHLRYLSFQGCDLKELESYIGNLLNLQTLDLRVATSCKMIIPNILWKLERLMHLYLPVAFQVKGDDKLDFRGLRKLQILKNFDTRVCHAPHLLELTDMRILDATAAGNYEDLKAIIELMNKTSMSQSILHVRNFDCYSIKRRSIVTELFNCSSLHILHIGGHIGELPQINSSGLTKLSLSGSQLLEDAMATLGKVPKLWVLVLRDGTYVGEDIVLSDSGFPELRQLQLCGLHKLQRLAIEKGAMPNLNNLAIERCKSLEVPFDGLSSLARLQELTIAMMPIEFENGLRQVQQQLYQLNTGLTIKFLDDSTKEQIAPWLV